jgi:hypothetical protein
MKPGALHVASEPHADMQVRILGPDCPPLSSDDLHRLFPGSLFTPAREERLAQWCRVVAVCGARAVGIATYQRASGELRVPDFALDACSSCAASYILNALLDALELACLAGGCRRLVLMPPTASAVAMLRRRGYVTVREGCAGTWIEKTFA